MQCKKCKDYGDTHIALITDVASTPQNYCHSCLFDYSGVNHCVQCSVLFIRGQSSCRGCHNYCANCGQDHVCRFQLWRDTARINLPMFDPSSRLMGIEIEAVDKPFENDNQYWKRRRKMVDALPSEVGICHDGSVHDNNGHEGFEIVTPPIPIQSAEPFIKKICTACKDADFKVNDTCGLHVHFDARDIVGQPDVMSKVLRTIYSIEDIIFSMNPQSRWDNRYCQALSKNYIFEDFERPMNLEQFENHWYTIGDHRYSNLSRDDIRHMKGRKYGHAKYSGVNFHSLLYRGTVEFRYHAGTLEADKIMSWALFLSKLLNYGVYGFNDSHIKELYLMDTNQKKLEKMIEYFKITPEVAAFMRSRVSKFNKDFVKYQKSMSRESLRLKESIQERNERRQGRSPFLSSSGNAGGEPGGGGGGSNYIRLSRNYTLSNDQLAADHPVMQFNHVEPVEEEEDQVDIFAHIQATATAQAIMEQSEARLRQIRRSRGSSIQRAAEANGYQWISPFDEPQPRQDAPFETTWATGISSVGHNAVESNHSLDAQRYEEPASMAELRRRARRAALELRIDGENNEESNF